MSSLPVISMILRPTEGSHPFSERESALPNQDNKLKIGRAVAKLKQASNNLIFECKVLSRNHALIWHEGDRCFIQDTKSSNGTYVNNDRLSSCNEESDPREIVTGDVLQFGVDVTDSQKKVTHGCIIANIVITKNGIEVERPITTIDRSLINSGKALDSANLKELEKILYFASRKEHEIESKLTTMKQVVAQAKAFAAEGMKAMIQEDQLIARIEALEHQIKMYAQDYSETDLKTQLSKMIQSKYELEEFSKKQLQGFYDKRLEASQNLQEMTCRCSKLEEDARLMKTDYDQLISEYELTRVSNCRQQNEINDLTEKLSIVEQDIVAANRLREEEVEDARNKIKHIIEDYTDAKIQMDSYSNRYKECRKEADELLEKMELLESQTLTLNSELETAKSLESSYKNNVDNLIRQLAHLLSTETINTAVLTLQLDSLTIAKEHRIHEQPEIVEIFSNQYPTTEELLSKNEHLEINLRVIKQEYDTLAHGLRNDIKKYKTKIFNQTMITFGLLVCILAIFLYSFLQTA